jgi:Autotransporter beta-domain
MCVRQNQRPPPGLRPFVACIALLIAPSASYAQLIPDPAPLPAIAPLVDALNVPGPVVQQLNSLCSGSLQSEGCTAALGQTLTGAIDNLPAQALSDVSSALVPVITALELPRSVAAVVGLNCSSLPLSTACANLLNGLAIQAPAAEQLITNAAAASLVQTNHQVSDFALSTIVPDSLGRATGPAATLRSVTPTVTTFGISGISQTLHDGFVVKSPHVARNRTLAFDSLDAGITLGMRFEASKIANLPPDHLTFGVFGNYTNSDVDFEPDAVLRDFGFRNAGDGNVDSGSGGAYTLLTNGRLYGLVLASGEFGSASVHDSILNTRSNFDTRGFASSLIGGIVVPVGAVAKIDFRGSLNYLICRADDFTDSANIQYRDGKLETSSGALSVRLFTAWQRGQTVFRPFVQGGVDERFDYDNEIQVEGVNFSFEEGDTTLFGRVGLDFDVGDYTQAYAAFRADHNEDFDTIAGQIGLTVKLN